MASSYAHLECTTSSATTAIGATAEEIFDAVHGSVVFSSNLSSDITWAGDTSEFATATITVTNAGQCTANNQITMITGAGDTVTITGHADTNAMGDTTGASSNGTFAAGNTLSGGSSNNNTQAAAIAATLNLHDDIIATAASAVVTITQRIGGAAGNTSITTAKNGGDGDPEDSVTIVNFTGGAGAALGRGEFSFSRGGIYHVIVNAVTSQVTSDRIQTTTFNLNSAAAIYDGRVFIDKDMDPKDHTHQRIISIAAGDILHIKTKTGGHTMGIEKGTSITILEITSGVFASSTVTTAGSNNTTDAFNPFDTDGDGPAFASAGLIASGVTFTGNAGSMTVPSAGKYLIMINHLFAAGGSTNSNITMLLKEGSNVLLTNAVRLHSTVDPAENTMCVIEDLAADEVLTVSYDIGSGRCQAELGATFTVYKLEEGSNGHADPKKRGQDLYACVVSNQAGTAGATEVNPFDEDNLTGDATFTTRASNGITFAAGDGTFTVSQPGLYFVMHNAILNAASDVVFTSTIKVNGIVQATSNTVHIDSLPDPMNSTLNGFLSLKESDVVTVTIDANTAVNLASQAGSTLTIFRYYPFTIIESVSDGLISNDFTINTFSQGNLSVQYERNIGQVPFKMGVRGAQTLRGIITQASVVKFGDKKN